MSEANGNGKNGRLPGWIEPKVTLGNLISSVITLSVLAIGGLLTLQQMKDAQVKLDGQIAQLHAEIGQARSDFAAAVAQLANRQDNLSSRVDRLNDRRSP